jgi:hypothetical protein
MTTKTRAGITLRCVYCRAKKTITPAEAAALTDVPLCEKDGGPMVVVSARA